MYNATFIFLFVIGIALTMYLAVDAKWYPRPWRMFAMGLASMTLAFCFNGLPHWLGIQNAATNTPGIDNFAALASLICGAMGGALIGAAVSNRAMLLNREALQTLLAKQNSRIKELEDLQASVKDAANFDSQDPGDIALHRKKIETTLQLFDKALEAKNKLEADASALNP